LAALYGLSDNSIFFATLVQILLGSVTCGLVYLTARSLYFRQAALIAGVLAAAYGPLVFIDAQHLPSQLATFWAMLYLYAQVTGLPQAGDWRWFLMGFASGCAVLTRGNLAVYFALSNSYLVYSFLRGDEAVGMRVRRAGILAAGCAVVIVPATLLFSRHTGSPLPLPYSSGLNLFIGNDRRFPDRMAIRPGAAWEDARHEPHAHGVRNPAE
jgi:4-amino-4-deoxy-L-arabinose transferase-like glycosyltransferase